VASTSYTKAHRILHWLIAGVFLFILLTVLLRQNWMNKTQVGAIVAQKLSDKGIKLSPKDAESIGKAVRYPMWRYHVWAGYVLIGLYLIRMLVFRLQGSTFKSPFKKQLPAKERFKSMIYVVFYICFGLTLLTGMLIVWLPRGEAFIEAHHIAKLIHIQALYYSVAFIVLHLGGLVLGELGKDKGIISKMIHGG
jgi:cytochrome b561